MAKTSLVKQRDIFSKAALQLGYISIYWAWLEHVIDEWIEELAHIDEPQIAQAIVGNAEVRGKIQMAKALCFLRKTDQDWFEFILKKLDYIDNDLRVRRNQSIHAGWF